MGKNQSASNLTNIINYNNGNILFVSGSTTLMTISSSGAIITTGVISGSNILTSSYSQNSELLDNFDATSFVFTSSYNTDSSSFSTRVTNNESTASVLTTASASFAVVSQSYSAASGSFSGRITTIESKYATTGSNIFTANQTICGNLTTTGTITAQTINVQQVTSSIVYSCGSNIFGCAITDTQQFTGSVFITGSTLTVTGGTICTTGNTCFGGMSIINSCLGIGTSTPAEKLEVLGNARITSATGTTVLAITDTSSGGRQYSLISSGTGNVHSIGTGSFYIRDSTSGATRMLINSLGAACFACELTAKSLGTNDLILNNLNHEHANYVDGTRGSWLIQEGACDLFIINQVSCKKYKFNLIEIK